MKYFVYILKSLKSGRYYIGSTSDLEDRIKRHQENRSKSTKGRGPWELVYTEEYDTRSEGVRREHQLKKYKSHTFLEIIIKHRFLQGEIAT